MLLETLLVLDFNISSSCYKLLLVMLFYHSNRKATDTPCKYEDLSLNTQNPHKARYSGEHLKTDIAVSI